MPPTTSMVIVLGSPGSGKSEFIRLLAEPVKVRPNDSNTENRRAITVSPFIEDNQIVKLVKIPSFSEFGVNPTDAELLVDIAVFLEIQRRHQQAISGIIYMHRITDDGLQSPDVDRNLAMLSRIVGDSAMKNIVVSTNQWDGNANTMQEILKSLFSFPSQFRRYDGTKSSALSIVYSALKQTPESLRIQIELGADQDLGSTTAGLELIDCINELITTKEPEDRRIRQDLAAARRAKDKDKVGILQAELAESGPVLDRLRADQNKLESPVNWEQAEIDNTALDKAIREWHEVVTTDWKAKYDELYNRLKDGFNLRLQAKFDWPVLEHDTIYPGWLIPFTAGEELWAQNEIKKAIWKPTRKEISVYRAQNAAGRIGWVSTGNVTVIAS